MLSSFFLLHLTFLIRRTHKQIMTFPRLLKAELCHSKKNPTLPHIEIWGNLIYYRAEVKGTAEVVFFLWQHPLYFVCVVFTGIPPISDKSHSFRGSRFILKPETSKILQYMNCFGDFSSIEINCSIIFLLRQVKFSTQCTIYILYTMYTTMFVIRNIYKLIITNCDWSVSAWRIILIFISEVTYYMTYSVKLKLDENQVGCVPFATTKSTLHNSGDAFIVVRYILSKM